MKETLELVGKTGLFGLGAGLSLTAVTVLWLRKEIPGYGLRVEVPRAPVTAPPQIRIKE